MHDLDVYINHEHVATLTIDAQVRIFAAQTGLNPKLVSSRIKILCEKVETELDTKIIDMSILDGKGHRFIEELKQLIIARAKQPSVSADEMMRVSF